MYKKIINSNLENNLVTISIEQELTNSYIDYAMSVIISRALPDIRDGLKPVHRRILFAMNKLKNYFTQPYKKSARIVGEVIGKYHPHGDTAVYDSIVRMAQYFSLRYPLIDGQGNFGSVDGDAAAAMRYTEIRLSKIAHEMLKDLEKNTVDFMYNYDHNHQIPMVLPTKIPNLLINGSSGIAVGMATNIPPHNLTEVINGCLAYIENKNITIENLMEFITGPDFPTGGIITNHNGLLDAYKTGKGKIYIKSKYKILRNIKNNRETIIFYEIPYQINKSKLIENIAQLIKIKKIEGINNLRDESDKDGLRIVIELKKDVDSKTILNALYNLTALQIPFYINMVALHLNKPKVINLKQIIETFIDYRCDIIKNRIIYDLNLCQSKIHILEGFIVILPNIDKVINLIKNTKNINLTIDKLVNISWKIKYNSDFNVFKRNTYKLSYKQVLSILELKIYKLNNLEYLKIIKNYKTLSSQIQSFNKVLKSKFELLKIIKEELIELKNNFGDGRLTTIEKINNIQKNLDKNKNLCFKKKVLITLTNDGYIKSQLISNYATQHRGGKGQSITKIKNKDYIITLLVTINNKILLCFSNLGKIYWLKVSEIVITKRNTQGKPIMNFITLKSNEKITTMLPINNCVSPINRFIIMVTKKGLIKKTPFIYFYNKRKNGIRAINLNDKDKLIGVKLIKTKSTIMLFTAYGKAVRFEEQYIRAMGRSAHGLIGIKLNINDYVVSLIICDNEKEILNVTQNGYGKRTLAKEYPIKKRATIGVIAIKITPKNGLLIRSINVHNKQDVFLVTKSGTLVRINVEEISLLKRNTKGVILMKTKMNDKIADLKIVG